MRPIGQLWPSYLEALTTSRRSDKGSTGNTPIRIAIGGTGYCGFLAAGLKVALAERQFSTVVESIPMGGEIAWAYGENRADIVVWWISSFAASVGETCPAVVDVVGYAAAASALNAQGTKVCVVLPEILQAECNPWSPFVAWRTMLRQNLREKLPSGVLFVETDALQATIGFAAWFAPRYWTSARSPCHPDAATALGTLIGRAVAQSTRAVVKAVAVDLDNTLWGGVAGDDGPHDLALDPFGDGRPYLALQQFLLSLKERGIPLAIISKNDKAVVDAVFAQRSEMVLKRDDFIDMYVSWDSKHIALSDYARALNIGLDSICLIDDSPYERAEAAAALPGLIVPDLPTDPDLRTPYLAACGLFFLPLVGVDDAARTRRYSEEAIRSRERSGAISLEGYLAGLNMRLVVRSIGPGNLARATYLVQRTNQFNLSRRRHHAPTIFEYSGGESSCGFTYELADRFGDSGIVSVVLAKMIGEILQIDTWVLSCRAFGRGVEDAVYDQILGWGASRGMRTVEALFARTERNEPVRYFLERMGFEPSRHEDGIDIMSSAKLAAVRHYLSIEIES